MTNGHQEAAVLRAPAALAVEPHHHRWLAVVRELLRTHWGDIAQARVLVYAGAAYETCLALMPLCREV
ncbi:MAG TPA: hypothetical protein VJN88_04970, partial [Ktedonobacterales bacterium]|nr:hypothetical protein [Ktedonobacterales bacterium]